MPFYLEQAFVDRSSFTKCTDRCACGKFEDRVHEFWNKFLTYVTCNDIVKYACNCGDRHKDGDSLMRKKGQKRRSAKAWWVISNYHFPLSVGGTANKSHISNWFSCFLLN